MLKQLGATSQSTIHNSSWGFGGCHVTFKNSLDSIYDNVIHTDVRTSTLPKTAVYDITEKSIEYSEKFDFVLNISTVEEVNYKTVTVLQNLYDQVKPGGCLIVTFDHIIGHTYGYGSGSMLLHEVEEFVGKKLDPIPPDAITPFNSPHITNSLDANLRCGVLVLRKPKFE
jgi:SAM-dependent methyltransferase